MGKQVHMATTFQRQQMKILRLVPVVLSLVLVTGCIQEAKWTWTGDTHSSDVAGDGVTGDGKGEISPSDVPGGVDTDAAIPKDTKDTIEPLDTVDAVDICIPDCIDKECGSDGCGGSCGTCGDDDPCNGSELCEDGTCAYDSPPDCDDDNPCTTDSCIQDQGCENTAVADIAEPACDDGNPCTESVCISGECKNPLKDLEELVIEDCLCDNDEACDPLEDDNLCNGTLVCDTEAEIPTCMVDEESVVTCTLPVDSAPECNTPVCVPATGECGVGYINEDGFCDDGDACTQGDGCDQGECKADGPVTCDDSNGCTDDSCELLSGCVFSPNEVLCDDGDDCTHSDVCDAGICAGIGYVCDNPAQCETAQGATCNGDGTCTYPTAQMDGQPCDDGNLCTDNDLCQDGLCLPGLQVMCDSNSCTEASCDPAQGCVYSNIEGVCTDDDPCTTGDHCEGGACISSGTLDCDDGNDCTDDSCVDGVGCDHTPGNEGGACDGGAGTCVSGICVDLSACGDNVCGMTEDCVTCSADCGCDLELDECTQATTGVWVCAAKMVEVPAGNFWMGCNSCEGSAVNDTCIAFEHPYHEVFLDTYEIDRSEVTAGQYAACVAAEGCAAAGNQSLECTWEKPGYEGHPINCVTWYQAEEYCTWAGKELCTEAQWEKGARGGCEHNGGPASCKAESRKYPWGNDSLTCDLAILSGGCDGDTEDVCSRSPAGDSPYGLCDMAGNVWEWVADKFASDYYCAGPAAGTGDTCPECGAWWQAPDVWNNPEGPESGNNGQRGGGFTWGGNLNLRVSSRHAFTSSDSANHLGFRCCRSDCGDGVCDAADGEDCSNCIQDCVCTEGNVCADGVCCAPDCDGKDCGPDGCGGSCGVCAPDLEECTETTTGVWVCAAKLVEIPAGNFWMGCNETVDDQCQSDEYPYHEVHLDVYEVDVTEVTAIDYEACVTAGGCAAPSTGTYETYQQDGMGSHPINHVTWYQAKTYCEWVGKRLPSEAEWEKAARGGCEHNGGTSSCGAESRKYPWGNELPTCGNTVMYDGGNGCGTEETWPVCSKSPAGDSPYGLCDMAGNVTEWVADWYSATYYEVSPADNPPGPAGESLRGRRGGGFGNADSYGLLRSSSRFAGDPFGQVGSLGFRCCRSDCGDGICDAGIGEDCSNCIQDCGCGDGDFCSGGACVQVTEGFVPIKAGSFWMGSPAGGGESCPSGYTGGGCDGSGTGTTVAEPGRYSSETFHEVTLSIDFEMQITELTQGEWKAAFSGWNPSGSTIGDTNPVETVSWFDSLVYANWKSAQEGYAPCYEFTGVECELGGTPPGGMDAVFCLNATHGGINLAVVTLSGGALKPQECEGYRLPTEAEWEYSARAGTVSAYHNGQGSDSEHLNCEVPFHLTEIAWYCGNDTPSGTKAVGGKAANDWGLKDMSGNVCEWCWDRFCAYTAESTSDPAEGACGGSARVVRCGHWSLYAKGCRSASRSNDTPGGHYSGIGFRLVRTLSP